MTRRSQLRRVTRTLPRRQRRRIEQVLRDHDQKRREVGQTDRERSWSVPPLASAIHHDVIELPANGDFVVTRWAEMPGLGPFNAGGPRNAWGTLAQYVVGIVLDPLDPGAAAGMPRWTVRLQYQTRFDQTIPATTTITPVLNASTILTTKVIAKFTLGGPADDDVWDAYGYDTMPLQPAGGARVIIEGEFGAVLADRSVFWGVYSGPNATLPLQNPYRATIGPVHGLVGSRPLPSRT